MSSLNRSDISQLQKEWEVMRFVNILQPHLAKIKQNYHIKSLGIFGSYVKNLHKDDSDLDVLVEFEELPSLLGLIELENILSDLLNVPVDIVIKDNLKPTIAKHILGEVVAL